MSKSIFLEKDLSALGKNIQISCLDIGARGGIISDLKSLSVLVNAIGFEPDPDECKHLNEAAQKETSWRSVKYLPVALGKETKSVLNLYRQRGCSSLLEANTPLAKEFLRDDNYILDDRIEIETISLDKASELYDFEDASYIKIDIQGGELDVFESGERLISSEIFAIRTEVSFLPIYKNQPLVWDIAHYLDNRGFVPIEFPELHSWRRLTRAKLPRLSKGSPPYSKGQLIHGDILFFKDTSAIESNTPAQIKKCIKAALISAAHGHIDYAHALLSKTHVSEYLKDEYGLDSYNFLYGISKRNIAPYRKKLIFNGISNIAKTFKRR